MTTANDELVTARQMRDFALQQYLKFHHQTEHRAKEYGNKAGRDEAGGRALSASIAFFLATQRIEQLTGTAPGAAASVRAGLPAPQPVN